MMMSEQQRVGYRVLGVGIKRRQWAVGSRRRQVIASVEVIAEYIATLGK